MKNVAFIGLAFMVLGVASCDYISTPLQPKSGSTGPILVPPTRVDSTTKQSDDSLRVLAEDFTAHHCPNCPPAAKQCEVLFAAHTSQVVFWEVNCNSPLGAPYPIGTFGLSQPIDSAYQVDYRTNAGTNWDGTFINSASNGIPGTMVNRLYYSGTPGPNDLFLNGIDVSTPADSLITANNPLATIHIVDSLYVPPTSALSMTISTKILNPVAGNKYYLVVGLAEDSIFDWQDSINHDVQYYLKRMTFRGTINDNGSGLGDSLSNNNQLQFSHYTYTNTANFIYNSNVIKTPSALEGAKWNMAHMYIVAFIYQVSASKNQMVLQVQRLHI